MRYNAGAWTRPRERARIAVDKRVDRFPAEYRTNGNDIGRRRLGDGSAPGGRNSGEEPGVDGHLRRGRQVRARGDRSQHPRSRPDRHADAGNERPGAGHRRQGGVSVDPRRLNDGAGKRRDRRPGTQAGGGQLRSQAAARTRVAGADRPRAGSRRHRPVGIAVDAPGEAPGDAVSTRKRFDAGSVGRQPHSAGDDANEVLR